MRNITVTVAEDIYLQARIWAAEHDTSVSAVVEYMLCTLRTEWRARAFLVARAKAARLKNPPPPPPPLPREEISL